MCSNQLVLEELLSNKTYSQSSVDLISITGAQGKKIPLRSETQQRRSVIIKLQINLHPTVVTNESVRLSNGKSYHFEEKGKKADFRWECRNLGK